MSADAFDDTPELVAELQKIADYLDGEDEHHSAYYVREAAISLAGMHRALKQKGHPSGGLVTSAQAPARSAPPNPSN